MPGTTGDARTSQLRLASARRRLGSFLDQIDELLTSSFPHPDAREALVGIGENFRIRLNGLALPSGTDPAVVDQACIHVGLLLERWTMVLGFILRSTNIRNAFEVQFALKRLVRDAIGEDVKLLMSSEWDYVPFTYPMTLDLLPNYVLVGAPAPESNNVLITPLAGHEIGHSAWRRHDLKGPVSIALTRAIDEVLAEEKQKTDEITAALQRQQRSQADLTQSCLRQGMRQLEELFCDHFGLYTFGPAYLFAFEYFLAPGAMGRSDGYPSTHDRVAYLLSSAQELGLSVEPDLFDRWHDSSPLAGLPALALELTDAAVRRVEPLVRARVFEILKDAGLKPPVEIVVARVLAAFDRQEPDAEGASLAEIITAGWRYIRREGGLSQGDDRARYQMLGELMLKSVEVAEFCYRVSDNA